MSGGDADQRAAAIGGLPRGGERDLVGVDRRLALARLAAQPAAQHVERHDVVGRLGQRGAALGQRQRALRLQRRGLRQRRVEIGARRLGRFGAIEVLGDAAPDRARRTTLAAARCSSARRARVSDA